MQYKIPIVRGDQVCRSLLSKQMVSSSELGRGVSLTSRVLGDCLEWRTGVKGVSTSSNGR